MIKFIRRIVVYAVLAAVFYFTTPDISVSVFWFLTFRVISCVFAYGVPAAIYKWVYQVNGERLGLWEYADVKKERNL